MVLGGLDIKANDNFSTNDFDFSPMEERIGAIENQQKYILIGLAILVLILIMKK